MKKLLTTLLTAMLLVTFIPPPAKALTSNITPVSIPAQPAGSVQANALIFRINEIKAMDKSNLSFGEKQHLRRETRSLKKQLRAVSGGVYLSAGAVILVLLLLIILL